MCAHFLFGGFPTELDRLQLENGFENKNINLTFVSLNMIYGKFGEDSTRFVAAENFFFFLLNPI